MNAFKTIGIFSKQNGQQVTDTLQRLYHFLEQKQLGILAAEAPARLLNIPSTPDADIAGQADLIIVVGGDGTLLGAGRLLAETSLPLVGINLGRLGFLVDILPEDLASVLEPILQGAFIEESRCMLTGTAMRGDKILGSSVALNDVVLHARDEIRMIEFTTLINGTFVNTQRADGLIVSTPTGSTAYALSSGGPILHPVLEAIVLVPICAHNLTSRPLVVPASCHIEIQLRDQYPVDSRVSFDGQNNIELIPGDRILIETRHEKMRLLHPLNHDYYHILRTKLHWGKQP
ncbi:MAG: NAD(+) kinase [Thiothrix sp.]|nr:NAD(+) kinase [Thiothrix sp.]HPQ94102.1 NAD(+) kinase [Thiolinea sp.]